MTDLLTPPPTAPPAADRPALPQFDVLAKIELPPEVRTKIERGNAIRLLGLKETAQS